jgi:glycosyltransferase involved in cell wall biosynthesis
MGNFHYEFAAAAEALDPTIETLDTDVLHRFHPLVNVRVWRLLWQRGILSLVGRQSFSLVIFLGDWSYLSTWLAAAYCRLTGVRVVMWTHGWSAREYGMRRILRLAFYRLAHMLFVYGTRSKELGQENGYPKSRIHVIYNSISTQARMRQQRDAYPRCMESPIVLCIGRLTERKRLGLLMSAVERLRLRNVPVILWLIGDGPALQELTTMCAASDLNHTFHGAVYDQNEVYRLVRQARVSVVPGDAGLSVIQSLECGVPVITNDSSRGHGPEVEAIIDGLNGSFFREGDVEALASCIEGWLSCNVRKLQEASQVGIRVVERRYSAESQLGLIEQGLNALLHCSHGRRRM